MRACLRFVFSPVVLLLLFFYGLGHTQDITPVNGVQVVKNGKLSQNPTDPSIRLQKVRTYGGIDAANEEEMLYYPVDLAFDREENLYILDQKGPFVAIYDAGGKFLRKFGRKGQGPGEFQLPNGIAIDGENIVYISEWLAHQMIVLTTEGEAVRRFVPNLTYDMPGCKAMSNGNLVCGTTPFPCYMGTVTRHTAPVMDVFSPTGESLVRFGELTPFADPSMTKTGNAVFYALDGHDNIYVTYRFQNRIEKYDALGKLLLRITRKVPYNVTTKIKLGREYNEDGGVQGVFLPKIPVVSCGIAVDGQGRIWVLTFSRQPKYNKGLEVADKQHDYVKLEVFSDKGLLVEDIPMKEAFDPSVSCLFILGDRLFLLNLNQIAVIEYAIEG